MKDEILSSIEKIGTCEDEMERRSLLTDLKDSMGKVFDEVDVLTKGKELAEETLKTRDEELKKAQEYNMSMFVKLNAQKEEGSMESETGVKEEKVEEFKSYDELSKRYID